MADIHINGFEILEKLGEGGLGAVYKARQVSLDRLVAIKTLPKRLTSDPAYVEQFQMEAKTAATLRHPNIVQIHEAGHEDGLYFFVMEFVAGYSVDEWLSRKGRLKEKNALLVAESIAFAMEYAWDKARIIHGDIKPANIMVDDDGTIKLTDFLAVTRRADGDGGDGGKTTVAGTPNFMSPEQVSGSVTLDFRTDIYALGAVLYQLTSGRLPFGEVMDADAVMRCQLNQFVPDPCDVCPSISYAMAWLIEKLMIKDREYRYVSWRDALTDIHRVMAHKMPLEPLPASGASTVRRAPNRNLPSASETHTDYKERTEQPEDTPQQSDAEESADRVTRGELWLYAGILLAVVVVGSWLMLRGADRPESARQAEPPLVQEEADVVQPAVSEQENAVDEVSRPAEAVAEAQPSVDPVEVNPEPSVEPDPPSAEPPVEDHPVARQLDDFGDYLSLMDTVMRYTYRRSFDRASEMLERWINRYPESDSTERVLAHKARVTRLSGLADVLAEHEEDLVGLPVRARRRITGRFKAIEGSQIVLVRSAQGGEASFTVPLSHVYERDFSDMLKRAEPEGYPRYMVMLRIARGQFEAARDALDRIEGSDEDTQLLREWVDEWETIVLNLRADKALDAVARLVDSGEFVEAQDVMDRAREKYGDTDMFTWHRGDEVEFLEAELDAGLAALEAIEVAEEEIPEIEAPETPGFLDELSDDEIDEVTAALPAEEQKVVQLDVDELVEKMLSYDGRFVKLGFTARGDIKQKSAETYVTQLGTGGVFVPVEFGQEGFKWIQNIPRWVGKRRRTVYGVVDAGTRKVVLIGRTKTIPMGRQAVEYSW